MVQEESASQQPIKSNKIQDFATGKWLANTPEEAVRQKIEKHLVNELGYLKEELEVEKEIEATVGTRRVRVRADVAVNIDGKPVLVIETKAPNEDIFLFRDQAKSYAKVHTPPIPLVVLTNCTDTEVWDVLSDDLLGEDITAIPHRKHISKLVTSMVRILTPSEVDAAARTLITFVEPKEFAQVFDRCHDIIRTQKGLDARGRLYEMCKLVIVKLYEEDRERRGSENRFCLRSIEKVEKAGLDAHDALNKSFEEVKTEKLRGLFDGSERIELKAHTMREIVGLLEPYSLSQTREDVLGVAFETFLKGTMTGKELGEFFTPREAVDFMVRLVDPQIGERVLDPACGSGGFLIKTFFHVLAKILESGKDTRALESDLVNERIWGIDIDAYLVKLCRINLKIHGDGYRNIYRANALDLVDDNVETDHLEPRNSMRRVVEQGGFDVILTNPPFGSGEGKDVTDPRILLKFEMGRDANRPKKRQIPQILFVELCTRLLRPGGRLGIVIPDSILNNKGVDFVQIRGYMQRECIIESIVSLPEGTFRPYGSGVKASLMYCRKKRTAAEKPTARHYGDAQWVGYDTKTERQYRQIEKNDLPQILRLYKAWRKEQSEGTE